MKITFKALAFSGILSLVFMACSKNDSVPTNTPPTVTTTTPTAITSVGAMYGGNVTLGTLPVTSRGVCIATNANPTYGDIVEITGGSGAGSYTVTGSTLLTSNTVYHVRAFVQTAEGIYYGNDVSFTTLVAVTNTTYAPTDILTKTVLLKGRCDVAAGATIYQQGFCLKTSPTPLITDINVTMSAAPGDFSLSYTNLQPNTLYYVRTYSMDRFGVPTYGNEINFRTTGYLGSSGGYVFYDKGSVTNGWRYLEVAPNKINYNVALGPGSLWGCSGSFVSQTVPDFGKGLENTTRIMSQCANANCAARVCRNYSIAGLNDWFLPSREEAITMFTSLITINPTIDYCWTSTEYDATNGYYIYRSSTLPVTAKIDLGSKTSYLNLWPVRRF